MHAIRTLLAGQKSLYSYAEHIRDWKPVRCSRNASHGVMPVRRGSRCWALRKAAGPANPAPALKEMSRETSRTHENRGRPRRERPAGAGRAAGIRDPGKAYPQSGFRARPAGPRARTGHHPRQRPAGRPAGAGECRRPGPGSSLPARCARRANPGNDRLLARPGTAERAAGPPGRLPDQPDPGQRSRPGVHQPVQTRRPRLHRAAGPPARRCPRLGHRQRWPVVAAHCSVT